MDFKQALADAAKHGRAEQAEVITLNEYIDRVAERPTIAATAHQRIYDMIRAAGFTDGLHAGEVSYNFFRRELFGLDVPLDRLVRNFETAAQGHETRRRILLLWGPPGGAKSSVAALLKRGLEDWSRTDDGAVVRRAGMPDARGAVAPGARRACAPRRTSTRHVDGGRAALPGLPLAAGARVRRRLPELPDRADLLLGGHARRHRDVRARRPEVDEHGAADRRPGLQGDRDPRLRRPPAGA